MNQRTFASDNNSGVHPHILQALQNANEGHVKAYGDDPITQNAIQKFKRTFLANMSKFILCMAEPAPMFWV